MFSSVTGSLKETTTDALYWKTNMVSAVRFSEALTELVNTDTPTMIIEIGPRDTGWAGFTGSESHFTTVEKSSIVLPGPRVQTQEKPYSMWPGICVRTLVDLPNYSWNHSIKYWHENAASHDWRNKKFITHDLLGFKIPSTAWESPTWRKHLKLADVPWLRGHKMGPDVLIPGERLATMALEAMYQKNCVLNLENTVASNELAYRFRDVRFERAVVEEKKPTAILLTLTNVPRLPGLIRIHDPIGDDEALDEERLAPLKNPQLAKLWYKAQREVGMGFSPSFQTIKSIESVSGSRTCRNLVSLEPPASEWAPQSCCLFHPAILDGCLQIASRENAARERSLVKDTMITALVDDIVINRVPSELAEGLSVAESL
ncbi:Acyl transferase/acyl hydrolase/lysophospholipase [Penicillium malachiteum]|uniref:Acyl transferase/acyl hydrolase/lysophospholipase n=1 Tax=Penicillium malachiteum TaxID=1324776 RepID=A0AAD6HNF1_9EURO|nr:Acyl transferase/acyl hydrolase/lysophospholipase [Penicillium malachiteum]